MARGTETAALTVPGDEDNGPGVHWIVVRHVIEFDKLHDDQLVTERADQIADVFGIDANYEAIPGVRVVRTERSYVHPGCAPN